MNKVLSLFAAALLTVAASNVVFASETAPAVKAPAQDEVKSAEGDAATPAVEATEPATTDAPTQLTKTTDTATTDAATQAY